MISMEPTKEDLKGAEFNKVWAAIKGWDIERSAGEGLAHATGTDVMTILNALKNPLPIEKAKEVARTMLDENFQQVPSKEDVQLIATEFLKQNGEDYTGTAEESNKRNKNFDPGTMDFDEFIEKSTETLVKLREVTGKIAEPKTLADKKLFTASVFKSVEAEYGVNFVSEDLYEKLKEGQSAMVLFKGEDVKQTFKDIKEAIAALTQPEDYSIKLNLILTIMDEKTGKL